MKFPDYLANETPTTEDSLLLAADDIAYAEMERRRESVNFTYTIRCICRILLSSNGVIGPYQIKETLQECFNGPSELGLDDQRLEVDRIWIHYNASTAFERSLPAIQACLMQIDPTLTLEITCKYLDSGATFNYSDRIGGERDFFIKHVRVVRAE